jgi:hypothetical protein
MIVKSAGMILLPSLTQDLPELPFEMKSLSQGYIRFLFGKVLLNDEVIVSWTTQGNYTCPLPYNGFELICGGRHLDLICDEARMMDGYPCGTSM